MNGTFRRGAWDKSSTDIIYVTINSKPLLLSQTQKKDVSNVFSKSEAQTKNKGDDARTRATNLSTLI